MIVEESERESEREKEERGREEAEEREQRSVLVHNLMQCTCFQKTADPPCFFFLAVKMTSRKQGAVKSNRFTTSHPNVLINFRSI